MSQVNNTEELVLPAQYLEELTKLSNELLQHELNFCRQAVISFPEKYLTHMKKRLAAAETEVERRFLS